MEKAEKELAAEVEALLAEAARVDAEEDGKYGKGKRGDELPAEVARREKRLEKIREAKAALEQEAREAAAKKQAEVEAQLKEREKAEQERGRKLGIGGLRASSAGRDSGRDEECHDAHRFQDS